MSYFTKQKQQQQPSTAKTSKRPSQMEKQKPFQNNNKIPQAEPTGKVLKFTEDEVAFLENSIVTIKQMIPNEQGENQELMEMITTCEQIISARLDQEAGFIGDSA